MVWKPHVTVAAIVESDGRFLIVEEMSDDRIVYNQPAGHLEPGESLLEAVVRETLEETACHFQPSAVTGIYRWTNPDSGNTYLRVCFTGICMEPEPGRQLDTGIMRALWMTPAELRELNGSLRSPMVLRCIDDYLGGVHYPLALLTEFIADE